MNPKVDVQGGPHCCCRNSELFRFEDFEIQILNSSQERKDDQGDLGRKEGKERRKQERKRKENPEIIQGSKGRPCLDISKVADTGASGLNSNQVLWADSSYELCFREYIPHR